MHDPEMRPREVLAANLRALMAEHPDLDTLPKITKRTGISNGTLDRMRRSAAACRIDELEPLALAFGLEPWELLVMPQHRATLRAVMQAARALAKAP